MTEAIAKVGVTLDTVDEVLKLGTLLAQSGYFQDAKMAAQAVVKVLAGRELGFGPIASMTGFHIVNGKPVMSATLMAAAVQRSGRYRYRVVELTETACKLNFYEGKELIGESPFSMQDAEAAGLTKGANANWSKYKRNMLFARALSNGVKWYCPDVTGGPVYTPDEFGIAVDAEGEVLWPAELAPHALGADNKTFTMALKDATAPAGGPQVAADRGITDYMVARSASPAPAGAPSPEAAIRAGRGPVESSPIADLWTRVLDACGGSQHQRLAVGLIKAISKELLGREVSGLSELTSAELAKFAAVPDETLATMAARLKQ